MLNNQEIRILAKQNGVRMWEVARHLQVSEATMTRMLRANLKAPDRQRIVAAINELGKAARIDVSK